MTDAIADTPPRRALRAEAYDALRAALVDGRIPPGAALSEPQLADMLETSRSPIREALGRLEVEGLVERTRSGRLRAARLDRGELEQLYVLRAALEGLAARLATPRVTMQDLEAIAETNERMEALAAEGDLAGSLAAGSEFHAAIGARCGNAPLVDTLGSVRLRITRYRAVIAAARPREMRAAEHRAVLQAMLDRAPERAAVEMTRHVEASAEAILRSVRAVDPALFARPGSYPAPAVRRRRAAGGAG
jgi:DNA-binding GntR family transcriptional regulator